MKKLIAVLLAVASGCATHRGPEPAASPASVQSQAPAADARTLPSAEKTVSAAVQPASSSPESSSAVSRFSQPGTPQTAAEGEKAVPENLPTQTEKPVERGQPPITALRQPLTPVPEQNKKPLRKTEKMPVSDHKLQALTDLAEANDEHIINVYVGMYRKTVEQIMGTDHNPFNRRTISGTDGQTYEVRFYLTRKPRKGKPVMDRMLTPLIFKQGRVVAIGNYQLKKLIRAGTLDRSKLTAGGVKR